MSREVLLPLLRGFDMEERKSTENDGIRVHHRKCFRWDGHKEMGHMDICNSVAPSTRNFAFCTHLMYIWKRGNP